jgi:hypothetical protein
VYCRNGALIASNVNDFLLHAVFHESRSAWHRPANHRTHQCRRLENRIGNLLISNFSAPFAADSIILLS